MQLILTPPPDDDTAAAIIAAVSSLIAQEQTVYEPPARPVWSIATARASQGAPPVRGNAYATWHTVERARRADRWSFGIVGF